MKILFNNTTGKIEAVVLQADWNSTFAYKYESGLYWVLMQNGELNCSQGLDLYELDDLSPDNNLVCKNILWAKGKKDEAGDPKYFMYNNVGEWELHEKDNWVEEVVLPPWVKLI